jgi:hypothetical protein
MLLASVKSGAASHDLLPVYCECPAYVVACTLHCANTCIIEHSVSTGLAAFSHC